MSLQVLAQDMASRGRGPDTMLVHMAPKEVYGLQALARAHGGSLTINPQTGLPEAGFLSSLLPMLIGAGLTAATGGAAGAAIIPGLSNAATIGLGLGGLQTLRTGSLAKGLMAGLGAYGGAGLMGGVMGAGTGAVSGAAGAEGVGAYAANPANALQPIEAIVPPAPVATPYFPEGVGGEFMRPAYGQGALGSGTFDSAKILDTGGGAYNTLATPAAAPTANPMVAPPTVMPAQAFPSATGVAPQYGLTQEAVNIGDIYGREQAAQNAVAQKLATTPTTPPLSTFDKLKYGAAALAPALERTAAQAPVDKEQFRYAFDPGRLTPPTRMGDVGEYTYFRPSYTRLAAEGGLMDLYAEGGYTYDPQTMLYSREKTPPQQDQAFSGNAGLYMLGGAPDPDPGFSLPVNPDVAVVDATPSITNDGSGPGPGAGPSMDSAGVSPSDSSSAADAAASPYAAGGISHLGDYSDGGRLLRGPGDGVSDSIPATIANKRPARLADGEFVVPARIVSELGNGSTEAGARKLYAMMDRIQKNRTKSVGKDKVAVNSRSEQLLPA